jgi:hypothetical protein
LNIFAGAARYTQSTVSSFKYALFNNRTQERQKRANYDAEWETYQEVTSLPYGTRNLKAPHADAFNIGASTEWRGFVFRLDGSIRRHRDIIRTKAGSAALGYTRTYINSGKSDYAGVTFEIEKKTSDLGWAGRHDLLLSLTHSKTESNSRSDYVMEENEEGGNWSPLCAFYNGELVPADNLPATNFSTPLVVTFSDMASFWGGRVRLYNTLRLEKGGDGLVRSTKDPDKLSPGYDKYYVLNDALDPSQGGVYQTGTPSLERGVYYFTNKKYDNIFFWDMSLDFDIAKQRTGTLTLQLRVTNILNRHEHVNTTTSATGGIYTAGRQLYAGMQYKF